MIRYLYPEGKRKAFTLSYDDGVEQDIRFIDIIEKYGLKATFHLNSGYLGNKGRVSKDEISDIYKNHEIAMHTVQHPSSNTIPVLELLAQTLEDKRTLEHYSGRIIRGMSYPNGICSKHIAEIMRTAGAEYSRTVIQTKRFYEYPEDFMLWDPTVHHSDPDTANLLKSFNNASHSFTLFYMWGHTYEFDRWGDKWDTLKELCELAAQDRETKWFATNIEIYDYYKAITNLKFTADRDMVYNPSAIDVWIEKSGKDEAEIIKVCAGETIKL